MASEEQITTTDPAALRQRASELRLNGLLAGATSLERQALEPSMQVPAYTAAAQSLEAGNAAQASAILEQLLAVDDRDMLALTMLGQRWTRAGDYERAEPSLRRAVEPWLGPLKQALGPALDGWDHPPGNYRDEEL